jgi:hypothetical protein
MERKVIVHRGFETVDKDRRLAKKKERKFDFKQVFSDMTFYKKTYIQMGVCALILLAVVTLKVVDTPFSNEMLAKVSSVVSGEVDIDEDLGRLKFVSKQARQVFNEGLTMPIEAIADDVGIDEQTMMILGKPNEPVFATFSGVVESKTQNEIVIAHESGIKSVYSGLLPTAFVDDTVLSGQSVGYLQDEYLKVNIIYNEQYLNPDEFLKDSILR